MLATIPARMGKRLACSLIAAAVATAVLGTGVAAAVQPDGWVERGGERYWYEDGTMVTSQEIFDPASQAWYWLDADGTMARDKDVYLPAGNKWVRYDIEGRMVKGEDFRYGGWYWFDPATGAMMKGFVFDPSNGGKWVFYDYDTGQMAYGERYIDGAHGDAPGWMHFDEATGAVTYGPMDAADGRRVYYDDATGRMLYGWHDVDVDRDGALERCHFDEATGALTSAEDLQTSAPSKPTEPNRPSQPSDPARPSRPEQPSEPEAPGLDAIVCTNGSSADAHYHYDWCPVLTGSPNLRYLTAEQALASGLTPCSSCNPPA